MRFDKYASRKWTHIIIHHSWSEDNQITADWNSICAYHVKVKVWDCVGYNFGFEYTNGKLEICVGRPLDRNGAHTLGMNDQAIGICLIGNYDEQIPTNEQYDALTDLCRDLCRDLNISPDNIRGHRDYAEKTCPGTLLDMGRLINAVKGA